MTVLENHIRKSGFLVCIGMLVLLLSLLWKHPLAFMAFLALGCPLTLGGVLFFLYSLAGREDFR